MRVTNNMIVTNTKSNINGNKVLVDKYNTQMTTQNKISKPSEDPVIAIRSLRMQTSLSHIDQYLDNNIADAESWLDITNTALNNMDSILEDIYKQCVYGATDTLTADDRNTILKQLTSMKDQVYAEGNADFSGRTVFTGYRTTEQLTFKTDEQDTTYKITQNLTYEDITEARYTYGTVSVPADASEECDLDTDKIGSNAYDRIRLAYGNVNGSEEDGLDSLNSLTYTTYTKDATTGKLVADAETDATASVQKYETLDEWKNANDGVATVGDDDIVFIEETGELILGKNVSNKLKSGEADIKVNYTKTGFDAGEVRPEYYYDCSIKDSSMSEFVDFEKEDQSINFEISSGIMLAANTQASDVFSTDIGRDVEEMIDIVSAAIDAHDKVDKITQMMQQEQYADDESQAKLQTYLDAAEKEATYADDNLSKTYKQYITNFENYQEKVNIALTNVGALQQRVSLTKTRVENQQATVEELKTNNDKRDISDIIIDYYAAYNAYQASLTAASKVNGQTLLNYL